MYPSLIHRVPLWIRKHGLGEKLKVAKFIRLRKLSSYYDTYGAYLNMAVSGSDTRHDDNVTG